jgi:hypothetical protein
MRFPNPLDVFPDEFVLFSDARETQARNPNMHMHRVIKRTFLIACAGLLVVFPPPGV